MSDHFESRPASASAEASIDELTEAMLELASTADSSIDTVLQKIANLARRLGRAQYAALGIPNSEGYLDQFIVSGVSEAEISAIGAWPRGRGLLGALIRERRPIRLANLATDSRSSGFPSRHPQMTSFLGVPISWEGRILGNLYLTNKLAPQQAADLSASPTGSQLLAEFSIADQHVIEALAAHAAVAIENHRIVSHLRQVDQQREEEIKLISHDLRAPLTIILGQAQMIGRLAAAGNTATVARSVEAIVRGAKRLNGLIQDLVDAARLEAGHFEIRRQTVDLAALVAEVASIVEPSEAPSRSPREPTGQASGAPNTPTRIRIDASADLPPVFGDPTRLERVLTNLLINALKYSPRDRPVIVRLAAAPALPPSSSGPGEVSLEIADQGIGVAADELPRLFQRYYRTREVTSAEGLGLGLYISRKIIEAHGGRIWAQSPGPGAGTTIKVLLPAASPPTKTPESD